MMFVNNFLSFLGTYFAFATHYFIFPEDPCYAYRLLVEHLVFENEFTKSSLLYLIVYWIYGIFNAYVVGKMISTFCFIVAVSHLLFFVVTPLVHKELRLKNNMVVEENGFCKTAYWNYNTSAAIRTIPNLMKYQRTLQVLLKYYKTTLGLQTFMTHGVMLQLCVYSQVTLITKWDELGDLTKVILLDCYLVGNITWLCSLDLLGRLVKESMKTISSWGRFSLLVSPENKTNVMVMKKFRRSCKPLIISYGNFYFVRRSTVLSFFTMTSKLTFKILVSTN